jgi:hypothetical protein
MHVPDSGFAAPDMETDYFSGLYDFPGLSQNDTEQCWLALYDSDGQMIRLEQCQRIDWLVNGSGQTTAYRYLVSDAMNRAFDSSTMTAKRFLLTTGLVPLGATTQYAA